jgi:hypothetical protein
MLNNSRTGFLLGSLLMLAACGGGGGSPVAPSAPAPTPPPAPVTVVLFQDSGPVEADTGGYIEFAIPRAGTLNATVDWTFATNQVIVAMTTDACNDFLGAFQGTCSNIGSPIRGTSKPKVATGTVNQAGRGRLWLANLGSDESVAVQITLTGVGAASASRPTLRSFGESWVRTK